MRLLPERRMESSSESGEGGLRQFDLRGSENAYSVPGRLIGEQVEARLYMDHVEESGTARRRLSRCRACRDGRKHRVDYRHIIDWLGVRKPGAFENYRYRDELFPTSRFRMVFDVLQEKLGRPRGSKEYLKILELAAKDSEVQVDESLRSLLEGGIEEISAERIETMLGFSAVMPCAMCR